MIYFKLSKWWIDRSIRTQLKYKILPDGLRRLSRLSKNSITHCPASLASTLLFPKPPVTSGKPPKAAGLATQRDKSLPLLDCSPKSKTLSRRLSQISYSVTRRRWHYVAGRSSLLNSPTGQQISIACLWSLPRRAASRSSSGLASGSKRIRITLESVCHHTSSALQVDRDAFVVTVLWSDRSITIIGWTSTFWRRRQPFSSLRADCVLTSADHNRKCDLPFLGLGDSRSPDGEPSTEVTDQRGRKYFAFHAVLRWSMTHSDRRSDWGPLENERTAEALGLIIIRDRAMIEFDDESIGFPLNKG